MIHGKIYRIVGVYISEDEESNVRTCPSRITKFGIQKIFLLNYIDEFKKIVVIQILRQKVPKYLTLNPVRTDKQILPLYKT